MAKVSSKDVVFDLGCGDGRIVCTAAKKFGARGVGVDIDPDRIKDSEKRRGKLEKDIQKLVSFKEADVFELDRAAILLTNSSTPNPRASSWGGIRSAWSWRGS